MFKFDFNVEADSNNPFCYENIANEKEVINTSSKTDKTEWYKSEKVAIGVDILDNLDVYKLNATILNIADVPIHHIVTGFLIEHITCNDSDNKDIAKAEQTHSDLIPGVYEGGAKIWECTGDLLQYLAKTIKPQNWHGRRVLDLGCGAGLLGIYAYICGALVHFQDYNKDVLTQITIPNVMLNVKTPSKSVDDGSAAAETEIEENFDIESLEENLQFYSGDWWEYVELTTKNDEDKTNKFDYILTSETIYNPQNQQKLLDTFYAKLNTNGVVLVAAKTYYFGVGGGLRQFEELITSDKRFQFKVVWSSVDGVKREILELSLK
ncbi:histidine protein methyltransferase 1 homolog [Bactrocera neohumeralis]|uniref:histidine protein methyltransferase 1 homolog n=1 Tax=Bactrocera tryoni TaxID=59916 RepID=UPI001A965288|nr:histidine protein methyltransferase 1 homolog [Bactrocera tryoni]XP_050322012.1 histidine protein methyltransferase 1 homolog [Bactrocera neohumeralis]